MSANPVKSTSWRRRRKYTSSAADPTSTNFQTAAEMTASEPCNAAALTTRTTSMIAQAATDRNSIMPAEKTTSSHRQNVTRTAESGRPTRWTALARNASDWRRALWLVTGVVLLLARLSSAQLIKYDGDINIGVLVDLHGEVDHDNSYEVSEASGVCGPVNVDAVQQVVAGKWAVEVINNQSTAQHLKIGLHIYDTCSNDEKGKDELYKVINSLTQQANDDTNQIIGLIGIGRSKALLTAGLALNAFHLPVITVDPAVYYQDGGSEVTSPNLLTTAPDLVGQAKALANIGYELGGGKISLISSSKPSVASFLSETSVLGVRVPEILELVPKQINIGPAVEGFLRGIGRQEPIVAVVLDANDVVTVAEHLKNVKLAVQPTWLIGSLGLELRHMKSWRKVFAGGAFVEPHMPELREFKEYFLSSLGVPDNQLAGLAEEYMAENTGCVPRDQSGRSGVPCSSIPTREMELRFQQDPRVSFVVKAVSALTASFRLVQLDTCGQSQHESCLHNIAGQIHQEILENLHKLSFTSMSGIQEIEGTRHHFTKSGRLVANKQIVYTVDPTFGLLPIGWYSEEDGLHVKDRGHFQPDIGTEANFLNASTQGTVDVPRSSPLVNNAQDRSIFSRSIDGNPVAITEDDIPSETTVTEESELAETRSVDELEVKELSMGIATFDRYVGRDWALGVLCVSIAGVIVSLWMLVYVNFKLCDKTLSGNQTMGLLLLLGNMLILASCVPWLLPPSEAICAVRHFLHPLSLCLCFGLLLIKVMQLRSLVSVGLGGKIPQINQLLSLLFIVMVQVVITTEWYVINMPLNTFIIQGELQCDVSKETFLLLHVYPAILLFLIFVYGMSVYKIKRNYNEGRWVLLATVFIIPIFIAWALVFYFASVVYQDASVAISLMLIGWVLILTIFLPKMHTISQQSKFKKLKLQGLVGGPSDSNLYTSYTANAAGDFDPNYYMGFPAAGAGYTSGRGRYLAAPPYAGTVPHYTLPPFATTRQPHPAHAFRFNGLNFLAPGGLGAPMGGGHTVPKLFPDWYRDEDEEDPEIMETANQFYHQNLLLNQQQHSGDWKAHHQSGKLYSAKGGDRSPHSGDKQLLTGSKDSLLHSSKKSGSKKDSCRGSSLCSSGSSCGTGRTSGGNSKLGCNGQQGKQQPGQAHRHNHHHHHHHKPVKRCSKSSSSGLGSCSKKSSLKTGTTALGSCSDSLQGRQHRRGHYSPAAVRPAVAYRLNNGGGGKLGSSFQQQQVLQPQLLLHQLLDTEGQEEGGARLVLHSATAQPNNGGKVGGLGGLFRGNGKQSYDENARVYHITP